ncbi:hypothetical protein [Aquitalea pelogenes]|uniref:hypothetical protein n=1 Tax=Aquitalea pelogenes TaxID=1293573 RepID=UPI00128EEC81|nr:hypothetical protein [Aquitalea pelogenes]
MQPQRIILHSLLPLKSAILASMKALYRFLLMLLLMLPALNVLAAGVDMAMAGKAVISADCMAHETHAACHKETASKMTTHAATAKAAHGMLCNGAGCVQLCTPSVFQHTAWSAAPLAQVGIFVPTQPAKLAGITLSPPHRPPLLA